MKERIQKSVFKIPKMDCPSEEKMVRMALEGNTNIKNLGFDFQSRTLSVVLTDTSRNILASLEPLNYGAKLLDEGL